MTTAAQIYKYETIAKWYKVFFQKQNPNRENLFTCSERSVVWRSQTRSAKREGLVSRVWLRQTKRSEAILQFD